MSRFSNLNRLPLGDLSWREVEVFNTAVQSRLMCSLGVNLDIDNLRSWSWPAHHWYLWKLSRKKCNSIVDAATKKKLRDEIHSQAALPPDTLIMSSPDYNKWSAYALEVCKSGREDFCETRIAPRPREEDKFMLTFRLAEEAIRSFDPVSWWRYLVLVRELVLVECGGLKSATAPVVFGAVLINVDLVRSPIHLASLLVHESSHLALNIKCSTTRFFYESNRLLSSPLRAELRPPLLVLHATYVSAHVALCMSRFIDEFVCEHRQQALQLGREAILDLEIGLNVLRESKLLTQSGIEIVDELGRVHERHISSFRSD